MAQSIEAPTENDVNEIARQLVHAQSLVRGITGSALTGAMSDLNLLQQVLNSNSVPPDATYSLQSFGIAFGKVFVENNPGYDWWMVEDEYGRDPAVRFGQTSLLSFPRTMISKRIEDGAPVDVLDLYVSLVADLARIRSQH